MSKQKSNVFSGGGVIPLNNRRTLLKSYIWNYVVSNSGKATLENSIKGDIDLELIGGTEQPTTTGKNLFDESKAVTGRINPDNGELLPETSYISSDYIEVQEGETYFQSGSGDGYYRAFYDMNKKFTSIPTKGIFKITVPVGSKFLRISGRKERFGDWMIEKGDKATPYEPYTEQTLTLTSDRPVTKWDKLVEQDGEYGWLYNVEKIALTGEERWSLYNKQFYTTAYDIQRFDRAFCECYDYSDTLHSLSKDCTFTIGAGIYPNSIYLKDNKYLRLLESGSENIVESLKVFTQYLKDMFGKGTPIEILLKRKKTQFVPLPQEEQTQLRNLHSYNGTTHINIDSGEAPCGINVAYKQKK